MREGKENKGWQKGVSRKKIKKDGLKRMAIMKKGKKVT